MAIESEKSAQAHYQQCVELSEDRPALHQVFSKILEEERRHEAQLVKLYSAFKEEFDLDIDRSNESS